jgi:hypothetical protein
MRNEKINHKPPFFLFSSITQTGTGRVHGQTFFPYVSTAWFLWFDRLINRLPKGSAKISVGLG